jgi:hypothetical protein
VQIIDLEINPSSFSGAAPLGAWRSWRKWHGAEGAAEGVPWLGSSINMPLQLAWAFPCSILVADFLVAMHGHGPQEDGSAEQGTERWEGYVD